MNLKKFLDECNNTSLFREYKPITKDFLKVNYFVKKEYDDKDLLDLRDALFFIQPESAKSSDPLYSIGKQEYKDLIHADLIKIHHNKKLIKKIRQELKMPYTNRGFEILKKPWFKPWGNYTSVNFERINSDYKKWFLSRAEDGKNYKEYEKIQEASSIVSQKIYDATIKVLKKWKLPWRYYIAINELILFNKIIPADSGICWHQTFEDKRINQKPRFSLSFDVDTTKDELINAIRKDECGVFKNRNKYLMGKVRMKPRKPDEKEELIKIYNQYKKEGSKDEYIFATIRMNPKFRHLRPSAIRDRIKRK